MNNQDFTQSDKELIGIVASVFAGCCKCTDYHFEKAFEHNIKNDDIESALDTARAVWDDSQEKMIHKAYTLAGSVKKEPQKEDCPDNHRRSALYRIAAAVAANNADNVKKYLEAAIESGVSKKDISMTTRIARSIQKRAIEFSDEAIYEVTKEGEFVSECGTRAETCCC